MVDRKAEEAGAKECCEEIRIFSHAQRGFASILWPEVMSVLFLNDLAVFKNIHFLYYLTFYLLHNDQ